MKEKAGGADQRGKTAGVAHRQVRRDPAAERQAAEETGGLDPILASVTPQLRPTNRERVSRLRARAYVQRARVALAQCVCEYRVTRFRCLFEKFDGRGACCGDALEHFAVKAGGACSRSSQQLSPRFQLLRCDGQAPSDVPGGDAPALAASTLVANAG